MAKYLIIGGVAGGATTAARLRRVDEHSEIIMFEKGDYISYANCGLPYYIGGVIQDRENLFVQTPESFSARFNMDVRVNSEVISIDSKKKQVKVLNNKTGKKYTEKYDKLVISTGAEPIKPPIPGINHGAIFTLRNVNDTDKIKTFADENKPKRAVVVGAGFIGLEMAENLLELGIFVTIVEMANQVMAPIDFEMAAEVHQHLKMKGVEFYLNDGVKEFKDLNGKPNLVLNSGREIPADLVILSIGVKPDSKLAFEAGLKTGERGGIVVDDYLRTSDKDIYALGDVIEFKSPITGKKVITYLAGPANKQGRILANNIAFGDKEKYQGSIATAIAKIFDLTVAATGIPEKLAKAEGMVYETLITHNSSHAGYYPDATPTSLKIVFNPKTGKLLGAQVVGYEGVDKRIDLFAAVIRKGGTIFDLEDLEHAYAPPYSSAKDPVNIAGFAAQNIIEGKSKQIYWNEIDELILENVMFVDVRNVDEFQLGTIKNATNIPLDKIRERMSEIPKDKKIIVFCGVGLRGYVAIRILLQSGYTDVYNLSGGLKTYEFAIGKQSNEDIFSEDYIGNDDMIYKTSTESKGVMQAVVVDACGLQCPGPIIKLKKEMDKLDDRGTLEITASDPGFYKDVEAWCKVTHNHLVSRSTDKNKIIAVIEKSSGNIVKPKSSVNSDGKTLVVFSDDFDRAIASFVIANGAAAMGKDVTMFFTFWGLNIIKKKKKPSVKKGIMGRMFGMMMPNYSKKLKLSKMHMAGMGTKMMRMRMKYLKIDTLEDMIKIAAESGVKFIACQMSADVMGVKKEELFDFVEIGGVAEYLSRAEDANVNLFI